MAGKISLLLVLFCGGFITSVFATEIITTKKKYTLSVCAIFRDEAPWFKEWIEYHRLVGVDHFYLYNNMSTDHFREVLAPYVEQGIVTIVDWATSPCGGWVHFTQQPALVDGCKRAQPDSVWVAIIDVDEFLVPVQDKSMLELLDRYKAYPGIVLTWHVFGTSHVRKVPPNSLLIEVLHRTSLWETPEAVKSIVQTDAFAGFTAPPHMCAYLNNKPVYIDRMEARINHYVNRTEDNLSAKIKNKELMDGKLTEDQIMGLRNRGNQVEDRQKVIWKFIPELRRRMGLLAKRECLKSRSVVN